MKMKTDTIAAIATAMAPSGIGIIRISGDESFSIIDKIYRSKHSKNTLSAMKTYTAHYGYITDGEEVIDEVIVLIMRAPHTYTREDTVEINCHGGILVMRRILETVLKYGARPADPGEFTKRAFLNGRIDLSQAESVIDIINSKNNFSLKSAMNQLRGSLSDQVKKLRGEILHEIAFIESALDDPEHINLQGYGKQLKSTLIATRKQLKRLINSFENGSILKEGINTVILGKPNAGKSSLLNVLARKDRAIVTEFAGTTRDILEEQIHLNGITLNIIDTAGIRDTDDAVEKIGVKKSKSCAADADLILYVVDSSVELDQNDEEIMKMLNGKKSIVLLNKSDLTSVVTAEEIKSRIDQKIIAISTKDGDGIAELENTMKDLFFHGELSLNDEIYITNIRHKNALEQSYCDLGMVLESIENEMPEDFFSIDLMSAYEELGSIIGESTGDDLINEIFCKFCVGK